MHIQSTIFGGPEDSGRDQKPKGHSDDKVDGHTLGLGWLFKVSIKNNIEFSISMALPPNS